MVLPSCIHDNGESNWKGREDMKKEIISANQDISIQNPKGSICRLSKFIVLLQKKGEMNEKWKNVK